MLGHGRPGNYLSTVRLPGPGLVLAVRAALAQQHSSIALDNPDDLSRRHQPTLAAKQLKCLAYKQNSRREDSLQQMPRGGSNESSSQA